MCVIVVSRHGLEMRIMNVSDNKSQNAKTPASLGTKPFTLLLQGENTITATPPLLAPLLMAALFAQSPSHRFVTAGDTQLSTVNSIFHRRVLA